MSVTTLLTLPTELHELIIAHLEFPATAHLKHTNHYFNNLVKDIDIYEAEKSDYAELHGLWACRECRSLLPSSRFSDKNKKGNRSKTGRKATKRFCVPCGIKIRPCGTSLYHPGDRILIGGIPHCICTICSQFGKGYEDYIYPFCLWCEGCINVGERIRKARLEAETLKERISRKRDELENASYNSDQNARISEFVTNNTTITLKSLTLKGVI